ncbi:MAG: Spy/CpxP family protein refolding chaperone [Candidatus Eremiobacteraeota bacterium]|nr:Spy/CpxP family protein refolding chaperone [Candidatus Eremiobacteraeota bacterium]
MNVSRLALAGSLAAALAVPLAGAAQTTPLTTPAGSAAPAARHHAGWKRALAGIALTAQQQSSIQALTAAYHQAHPRGSARDPQAQKALHASILNLLTPAQQTQFKTNVAAMRSGERNGNLMMPTDGAMRADGPMRAGGLMRGITLTVSQETQIKQLRAQFVQARMSAGTRPDPAARKALMTSIYNVLTPQQQAQFNANRAAMQRQEDGGPFAPTPTSSPNP